MAASRKATTSPSPSSGQKPDLSGFGLFVRLNPEQQAPVSRFGGRGLIGARRDPADPRKVHYTSEVVAIPAEELRRYRHEYADAVKSGHLIECSEDEYRKSLAEQAKEQEALQAEAKKRREERRAAAKQPPTEEPKGPEEVTANASQHADRAGD